MAICHNKQYEREFFRMMNAQDFPCFRVAGSGQAIHAVCDCVLFKPEPCLVEVKATKEKMLYMRSDIRKQLEKMMEVCKKFNLKPILAIKFKHRGWNIIELKELKNFEYQP